jgi:hypothetical protein
VLQAGASGAALAWYETAMTNEKEDAGRASALRARAKGIRAEAVKAARRAESMAPGLERDMLAAQAGMLRDGARDLETQALALDPALGTA